MAHRVILKNMQFISARPLIEKFRSGTFREEEVGPYFILYVMLAAIAPLLVSYKQSAWYSPEKISTVVITLLGILYLKKQNGGTFGNSYLSKYFTLGWVIAVRTVLLSIPVGVVLFALASLIGGPRAFVPAGIIFDIAFEVTFYWWLGKLFAACNPSSSEHTAQL
jgi:hypothetical protein